MAENIGRPICILLVQAEGYSRAQAAPRGDTRCEHRAWRSKFLPSLTVLQMFGYRFFQIVRKSSSSMKVLVSLSASILSMFVQAGPFGLNTHGELDRRVQDYMKKTGKPFLEAANFVSSHNICP